VLHSHLFLLIHQLGKNSESTTNLNLLLAQQLITIGQFFKKNQLARAYFADTIPKFLMK
jgi:hypothetical protein